MCAVGTKRAPGRAPAGAWRSSSPPRLRSEPVAELRPATLARLWNAMAGPPRARAARRASPSAACAWSPGKPGTRPPGDGHEDCHLQVWDVTDAGAADVGDARRTPRARGGGLRGRRRRRRAPRARGWRARASAAHVAGRHLAPRRAPRSAEVARGDAAAIARVPAGRAGPQGSAALGLDAVAFQASVVRVPGAACRRPRATPLCWRRRGPPIAGRLVLRSFFSPPCCASATTPDGRLVCMASAGGARLTQTLSRRARRVGRARLRRSLGTAFALLGCHERSVIAAPSGARGVSDVASARPTSKSPRGGRTPPRAWRVLRHAAAWRVRVRRRGDGRADLAAATAAVTLRGAAAPRPAPLAVACAPPGRRAARRTPLRR